VLFLRAFAQGPSNSTSTEEIKEEERIKKFFSPPQKFWAKKVGTFRQSDGMP